MTINGKDLVVVIITALITAGVMFYTIERDALIATSRTSGRVEMMQVFCPGVLQQANQAFKPKEAK
jgi:hypothetical protein